MKVSDFSNKLKPNPTKLHSLVPPTRQVEERATKVTFKINNDLPRTAFTLPFGGSTAKKNRYVQNRRARKVAERVLSSLETEDNKVDITQQLEMLAAQIEEELAEFEEIDSAVGKKLE